MGKYEVVVETEVVRSFRVEQVAGMFDVDSRNISRSGEKFTAEVPGTEGDWKIGVIVGPSGSGKSSVARAVYGEGLVTGFEWSAAAAVVDGFPEEMSAREVTELLTAVGFSSPPAWVRPYRVLSGGQRMRCDLARALASAREVVAFDEFTSVVDRTVARVGSACVAKAVRSGRAKCKRFVAVTCHYDVLDWLEPDWVVDMAASENRASGSEQDRAWLPRGCLQCEGESGGAPESRDAAGESRSGAWRLVRPGIRFEVRRCGKGIWNMFERHHYLSAKLHPAARCYAAVHEGEAVGFCATLCNMGHRGQRRVHRLVVLPDWQGIGIGGRLLDAVVEMEGRRHVMSIRTSHPGLIRSLKKSEKWRAISVGRGIGRGQGGLVKRKRGQRVGSEGRVTVSFRYGGGMRGEMTNGAAEKSGIISHR